MAKALVIVESPTKARTISRFLGEGYVVESSVGHIRDLPSTAAEIPARHKGEAWARLGVDVESDFRPLYVVPPGKRAQVKKLKERLAAADELYLATDEDREGEAIAWHLVEVLKPQCPVRRMVFHEITGSAIAGALRSTRAVDQRLVNAQEARRILDRLVGYEVSPLLWRKVRPRLSAGRVQSVAVRLVVEREWARIRFVVAQFAGVEADLHPRGREQERFTARLAELAGRRVAVGKDFDDATGAVKGKRVVHLDAETAHAVARSLETAEFAVADVEDKPFVTRPWAPFMTSTLQQEAARKLRFSAQKTMRVAQSLYESGYITYMRTDSTTLSDQALAAARREVEARFGRDYLPERPRVYASSSKSAQEAHEAIRPAGESFRPPESLRSSLSADQLRLYELIWRRTLASQMRDAHGTRTTVRIEADAAEHGRAVFTAQGKVITFDGFLRAYVEGRDEDAGDQPDEERRLPRVERGQLLDPTRVAATSHTTQPPPRYTEATLVKELEARGIGRPSTYASIIETIQDRGYVWHRGPALVPTFTAFAVITLMTRHLSELVDYDFTARMEDELDAIARGEREHVPWLHEFYFGPGAGGGANGPRLAGVGLRRMLEVSGEAIEPQEVTRFVIGTTDGGDEVTVRVGRFGPYVQVGDGNARASVPDDLPPDELTVARALELVRAAGDGGRLLGRDPGTGHDVVLKNGRFGPYVQLGESQSGGKGKRGVKARMASLWPSMQPDTLTLEDALLLLSFPKELGPHPETGAPVVAACGRFGPYVASGETTRSLTDHETLRTLTLEQAVEVLRQPRQRRGRGSGSAQELGVHPTSGAAIRLREGRFGPYVTDGVVNATVPRGVDPAAVTLDQALELLAAREQKLRDQGEDPRAPKPKRQGRGASATGRKRRS